MIRAWAALVCVAGSAFSCATDPHYISQDAGTGGASGGMSGGTGGVSGGATGGAGGMLADTTTQSYEADDPNIQYVGRVNFTNPKQVRFDLNAVSITARFTGTAVAVSLKDEFRYGKYVNWYDAFIDGTVVAQIVPNRNATKYVVANQLADGEHQITLVRRTEAEAGAGFFLGFSFAGTILPPPARPTRRLEFLGDSITAGAGMEAPNGSPLCNALPDGFGFPVENADKAFGPVIARALGAEVHVMGVSGIGLVRNWSNKYDARTLPQVYDLYSPELKDSAGKMDLPRWDAAQRATWIPDGIVIGLGTNDFSSGDSSDTTLPPAPTADAFAAAHIAFIDRLRGYYPDAYIVVTNSTTVISPALEMALTMVVDHYVVAGDLRVHSFLYPKIAGAGCVTHPNAEQHAAMAAALGPVIKTALGW